MGHSSRLSLLPTLGGPGARASVGRRGDGGRPLSAGRTGYGTVGEVTSPSPTSPDGTSSTGRGTARYIHRTVQVGGRAVVLRKERGGENRWDVLVGGERIGAAYRSRGTSAGYYGAWRVFGTTKGWSSSLTEAVTYILERHDRRHGG